MPNSVPYLLDSYVKYLGKPGDVRGIEVIIFSPVPESILAAPTFSSFCVRSRAGSTLKPLFPVLLLLLAHRFRPREKKNIDDSVEEIDGY